MKILQIAPVLLMLLATVSPVRAQEGAPFQMPETAAGKLIGAYLRAYNTSDTAAIQQFWKTYSADATPGATEERVERTLSMRATTGTLEPLRMLASGSDRTSLLVRSAREGTLRFDFRIEAGPPARLVAIMVDQAEADEGLEQPKASLTQLAADLDTFLTSETAADRFSGVVLIAQADKVVFQQPYGLADRERRVANNSETKFNLGSINKAFTALSIRQLAARGKLSLQDTLKKFLPDYPNPEAAEKVTVRHLLEMTSGIGDFFGERYVATPKESLKTIRAYLPLFADLPLNFEPGTRRQYSNGGYVVLGAIIEAVSGTDYYSYVRENIFLSAGMKNTDSYAKDSVVANRAKGYTRRGGPEGLRTNYETLPGRGSSAGGGYSTASDLLRYVAALREAKICSMDDPARQGFGVAGGAPGINAAFDWEVDRGTVIIVLTNFDPPAAERISRRIRAWMPH